MSSTFNGHIPPEIIPDSAHLSWDDPRPKCDFVLTNKSAWPIVYKIKVQHKILGWSEVYPAQGIVRTGSSCVISVKLELRDMREKGLASKDGHDIHVESWYISLEDALRSDPAKLLSAIKRKVENPRKPDTSVFQIRYVSPIGQSRQDTLPSIPQTPRLPPTPRSKTIPHSFQPASEPASATPAINIIPPSRQQTLASLSSNADSPAIPTSTSHPTATHEQIARYIADSRAPTGTLRRTKSTSSSVADSTITRSPRTRPNPIPMGSGGDNSPTGSAAGSFISAKGENADPGGPFGDAMDIDPVLVEEPATLTTGNLPPPSKTMMQLPFLEPTTQYDVTWIGPHAPNAPSPLHLSPTRGTSPDANDGEWMKYITVDRSYRGKVKKPQGQAFSCGGFSDVHKCEVQFATPADTDPKMAAVKVLRPVGLNNCDESEVLKRMIARTHREADAWSAIFHPNVVPLLGVTFIPVLSLISPWYEKGNLRSYLASNPNVDRLKLLLDVATGLAHLHSQNPSVVHGDIKPENVLINDNGDALIMDFGLAMVMEENPLYSNSHRQGGSVRWMAPELLLNSKVTRSCNTDVYSYGGVVFEVMTGEIPHSMLQDAKINFAICDPTSPKEPFDNWERYPQLPEIIKKIIMMCWSRRPEKRPSMKGIEEVLRRLWEESVQNRT
ncbi:hypothetical protein FRC04_001644 [Tulasnella sp. 424]|nr:hypothetical protein FRC04_001644 [Tulasnella sp. 424]KAG8968670.1 hypothetical protein FRC05_001476 [Tulasnella sp. 425]